MDTIHLSCKKVENGESLEAKELSDLKKRKLVKETKETVFDCTKSAGFSTKIAKPETDLSRELLDSGDWNQKTFKEYNYDALGEAPVRGFLHPLLKGFSAFELKQIN